MTAAVLSSCNCSWTPGGTFPSKPQTQPTAAQEPSRAHTGIIHHAAAWVHSLEAAQELTAQPWWYSGKLYMSLTFRLQCHQYECCPKVQGRLYGRKPTSSCYQLWFIAIDDVVHY